VTHELLRLASADNFRDVAGPGEGYPTRDGRRVRRGIFFRSNQLTLSTEDTGSLAELGITAVHDLRRADEIASHPSVELPGVTFHHHDVLGVAADDAAMFTEAAETVAMMETAYTGFVRSERARTAFATLLRHLAHDPLPQLFHCTAGKDRTGWASAVLLMHAGVDDDLVMADFLLSNEYNAPTRRRYEDEIRAVLGEDAVAVLAPVLEVRPEYLELSRRLVAEEYDDLDGYLRRGLGLDAATLDALADRLVAG
jgi:protein-tyrosine phosphatase